MQDLKILYLQSDLVWEDPTANRKRFETLVTGHVDEHHLIVLPETFTTGFPVDPAPFAETKDGETMNWLKKMAEKTGAVITGSFLFREENRFFNTLIWMTPTGKYERYDKRHVISMGGEDKKITKGNKPLIVELNGWRIKPMICYDLRFPVWSKNRLDRTGDFEYDMALYVANWPSQRSYPWDMLLIARAIENQSYVLGVNRVGNDGTGNRYAGHSKMVNAKGQIISETKPFEETAETVVISKKELTRFREKFNVGRDWDIFTILP